MTVFRRRRFVGRVVAMLAGCASVAWPGPGTWAGEARPAAAKPKTLRLTVAGVERTAVVFAPGDATRRPAPVVFGFHGHGGTAERAARQFRVQALWPQAIAVYPQGLKTPGRLTDPEGRRAGWQHGKGAEGDRDLAFFDALLARLKHDYRVDERRVFAMGHSNGGGFTYLLWAERGDALAAVAPSGAAAARAVSRLKPKPVLHVAGRNDPLVKFAWQERTIAAVRRVNQCEAEGREWGPRVTLYRSRVGAPVATFIHGGGHRFPVTAPPLIVRFFQEYQRLAKPIP